MRYNARIARPRALTEFLVKREAEAEQICTLYVINDVAKSCTRRTLPDISRLPFRVGNCLAVRDARQARNRGGSDVVEVLQSVRCLCGARLPGLFHVSCRF